MKIILLISDSKLSDSRVQSVLWKNRYFTGGDIFKCSQFVFGMYRNSLHVIPKCIRLCPCFYRFKMSERHAGTLPSFVLWCGRACSGTRKRLFRKLIRAFLRGGKAFFVKPDVLFWMPFCALCWYPGCYVYALKSAYTEAKYMLSGYTRFSVSLRCVVCRFSSTIIHVAEKRWQQGWRVVM